ncbi:hypothetical protein L1887_08571 [Cichorium endivia]|nr:hypothetical protein L1887_08571 [Cichorium endivia]
MRYGFIPDYLLFSPAIPPRRRLYRRHRTPPPPPTQQTPGGQMSKGLIWATADDLARNRGRILSLYRQVLRSLNSPDLRLNLAVRLHRKAQARAIFMLAAEERSIHNIKDLIDIAEYSLSVLRKGEIPKYSQ